MFLPTDRREKDGKANTYWSFLEPAKRTLDSEDRSDRIHGRGIGEALGIREVLSAPRSPWQRAYVAPAIGIIRRSCHAIRCDELLGGALSESFPTS